MSEQFTRWGTIKQGKVEIPLIERGDAPVIYTDHVVNLHMGVETTAIELGMIELAHEGPGAVNIVARLRIPNTSLRFLADALARQQAAQTPPDPENVN